MAENGAKRNETDPVRSVGREATAAPTTPCFVPPTRCLSRAFGTTATAGRPLFEKKAGRRTAGCTNWFGLGFLAGTKTTRVARKETTNTNKTKLTHHDNLSLSLSLESIAGILNSLIYCWFVFLLLRTASFRVLLLCLSRLVSTHNSLVSCHHKLLHARTRTRAPTTEPSRACDGHSGGNRNHRHKSKARNRKRKKPLCVRRGTVLGMDRVPVHRHKTVLRVIPPGCFCSPTGFRGMDCWLAG